MQSVLQILELFWKKLCKLNDTWYITVRDESQEMQGVSQNTANKSVLYPNFKIKKFINYNK